jgi:hypothetical protein
MAPIADLFSMESLLPTRWLGDRLLVWNNDRVRELASGSHQAEQAGAKPKLKRKECEEQLDKFHVELVKLQFWVKRNGARNDLP